MKVTIELNELEIKQLEQWHKEQSLLWCSGLLPDITVIHAVIERILHDAGILSEK